MKKCIGALITLMLFSLGVNAQNLVPDPGFENWDGSWGGWMAPLYDYWEANGSPDHHHEMNPIGNNLTSADPNCVLTANNFSGCGGVYAGQGCLGFWTGAAPGAQREWAATQLTQPLAIGECYKVSFWVQAKSNNWQGGYQSWMDGIGVMFSNTPTPTFDPTIVDYNTLATSFVATDSVIQDTMWHYIEMTYTADAAYNYIYVGIMGNWTDLNTSMLWVIDPMVGPYYWLDELAVEPMTSCCILGYDAQSSTDEFCGQADGTISVTPTDPGILTFNLYTSGGTLVSTNGSGNFSGLTAGDYYVEADNGVGCIFNSSTITVGSSPGNISGESSTDETCSSSDGSITITSTTTPVSYILYENGNPIQIATNTTGIFNGLPAGDYYVDVDYGGGCVVTSSILTINNNTDLIDSEASTDETCSASDGTITVTASPNPLIFTLYLNGNPTPVSTNTTGVFNGLPAGDYYVDVEFTGGCIVSSSILTIINNGAAANAGTSATTTICANDTALDLFTLLGGADAGGTWSPALNSGSGTFDPIMDVAGTYTYTVTNGCGSASADVQVTVNFLLNPGVNSQSMVCGSDPAFDMFIMLAGADPGGTWSPAMASGTSMFDPGIDAGGVYTYTVTNGCGSSSSNTTIMIAPPANATISAVNTGPFCETDPTVMLTATDPGGTWTGTGITDPNVGTFDPSIAGPGLHQVIYTIGGFCGGADTIDITVNAADDPAFSFANSSFCLSDPDPTPTITGLIGGVFTIDGSGVINASTGEVDLDASGQGNFTVTYTTNGTCPSTATFALTISNMLDATITQVGPYCEYDPALNLIAVDGGGTWSGTGIADPNTGLFDPASAGAGTHTITYTISGACGTTDNIDIVVTAADMALFSYPASTYCITELDPGPSLTGTLGGTFSVDNGGVINPTTGSIDLDASGDGIFTVTYITTGSCPDTSIAVITVSSGVSATISPAGPFCQPHETVLDASTPGGVWSGPGIVDPNTGLFNADSSGVGIHEIIYTVNGICVNSDTIFIEVYENPTISLPPSYTMNYGESVTIIPSYSGNGSFNWNPYDDLDCDDCEMPVASPESSTSYCVTLSNGVCMDTACTTVIVEYNCGEVVVPTAFTPNSGDINSNECVLGVCVINMRMRIYDRWGELVFESYDQNVCWDGTHMRNGKPMSTGVYVYHLEADLVDGTSVTQKGNITLIR